MPNSSRPTGAATAVSRALREFFTTETAGGVVLLAATVVALVWANSPWQDGYSSLWHATLTVGVGAHQVALDARHWVNDGLMALFFLVVGLEVKREFLLGELRERRTAALPIIAAVGGMVVPALLFLAVVRSGDAARGWGIPMATDIAFALGVLAIVGRGAPSSVRLFLLTLAIVDDIGAIVVIAVWYSSGVDARWLAMAVAIVALVVVARRFAVATMPAFVVLGVALWCALYASGVHPTLAGVVLGLLVPVAPIERLEHALHGWSSFVIVPVFALANAGIAVGAHAMADAVTSRVTVGVVVGLVVGKFVGISASSWAAVRCGVADLPIGVRWRHVLGIGALGGIGFTVSLFITGLAFENGTMTEDVKFGILCAAVLATAASALLLRTGDDRVELP